MRRAMIGCKAVRTLAIAAAALFMLAAIGSCTVRLARLWTSATTSGGSVFHTTVLEHGRLVFGSTTSPVAAVPISPIVNRQIEFGIRIGYEERLTNVPIAGGGLVTTRIRAIPVAMPLLIGSIVLVVLCLPFARSRDDGRCDNCGYNLVGLDAALCPECGANAPPKAQSKARN